MSTDICGDWQALRARLRVDGYIFVRGQLDPALVGLARQQAMDALTRSGWMTPDGRPLPPVRTAAATDAGFREMAIAEALNRLPYERRPQQFMGLLAGDGAFVYPVKVPRVVYPDRIAPGHKGRFVHQDYAVIGKQDMFTMWMPLQQIPFEMGPLAVLPGSSRIGWASPRRLFTRRAELGHDPVPSRRRADLPLSHLACSAGEHDRPHSALRRRPLAARRRRCTARPDRRARSASTSTQSRVVQAVVRPQAVVASGSGRSADRRLDRAARGCANPAVALCRLPPGQRQPTQRATH